VKLTEGEQGRIARVPTGNLDAYDLVLRGQDERRRTTREGNAEARRRFVKAPDLDPEYARAYVELGWAHLESWQFLVEYRSGEPGAGAGAGGAGHRAG
jgi:hypothetical protein